MSIHSLKPLLMHPRAPATTDKPQPFSLTKVFSALSSNSDIFQYFRFLSYVSYNQFFHFAFLSTKVKSVLLALITLPHWIFISQINLTSSSSTAPSGQCSYHFSFKVILLAQFPMDQFFSTVSCLLLY